MKQEKTYHCGTLTYTKAALVAIFAWLLWGDFCYTIMELVVPSVLPLKLKALASPNWLMGLILTTVPGVLNMTICPAVSFKSDRYRSRWGRRIPFIVWTLPFLCLSLVFLGCSEDIGAYLRAHLPSLQDAAPATVTIALIGVFMAMFQFFNMFVGSVFWYLFNDVVPAQFLSRFVGSFRIVGHLAGALYQYFIFRYAATNMREILIGASVVYFIGFTIMCVMVKEGEYPPVKPEDVKAARGLRGVKTYLRECFCHRWYWLFFFWTALPGLTGGIGIFTIFFNQEMGLSLDNIGKLHAIGGMAAMGAMYLAAVFVDRWHPMRVQVYAGIFAALAVFGNWVWIFVTLPGKYYFWLSLGGGLIGVFFSTLASLCGWPLLMRTFPKSRFGQFCSSMSLVRSAFSMVAGVAAGLFIDGIGRLCRSSVQGPYFVYRFNFLWSALFGVVTAALGIWAYAYWHRLGAEKAYRPPAPWSPDQVEDMDIVPTVGPQARWLSLSLRIFNAVIALPILLLPALMWWMHQRQALVAFRWYAILVLPYALVVWIGWKFLERGIRRDMARALANERLHNGILHHGVLMFVSVKYLLALSIWVAQIIMTVKLNMEWECILFGVANVLTDFLLIVGILVIWRMERGRSETLSVGAGPRAGDGIVARIRGLFSKKPDEALSMEDSPR